MKALGIDVLRFRLLVQLFQELSDRGEMLDQLGRNGVALRTAAWLYFAMSTLFSVVTVLVGPPLEGFTLAALAITTFLLGTILLSEAANSLVNPGEAMVLAHYPINGATYTAAKLTHLLRIVLFLVPGLNLAPALAALKLEGAAWWYPLYHLGLALALGLTVALLCCSVFGWLLRFIPAKRLKGAAQLAGSLPMLAMMWNAQVQRLVASMHPERFLPQDATSRLLLFGGLTLIGVMGVVGGLRALSIDYLMRVSSIVRGGSSLGAARRVPWMDRVAGIWLGGPAARAGFAYVRQMMLRDWQFRRAIVPMILLIAVMFGGLLKEGLRVDPFGAKFSTMHLTPHLLAMLVLSVVLALPFGTDYKGAWVFRTMSTGGLRGFALGIEGMMWLAFVAVPHILLLAGTLWFWSPLHALLFTGFSIAVASLYLTLALRLLERVPFTAPLDPARGAMQLPILLGGALAAAAMVGLQAVLLFPRPWLLALATLVIGAAATWSARASATSVAASMEFNLGVEAGESAAVYQEIQA